MAGGTHLELEERERLAGLKAEGLSLRAIARALGRAASTISRELRRNALPRGGYLPAHAEGCYLERRQRSAASCASACWRAGRRSGSPAG
jgi:IS30 family transposase